MLDWLGDEGDRLREAFINSFGPRCEPFGKQSTWIGGVSDGAEGVQWNASFDPRDERQWVSVNLEGIEYNDWPVARLIRRELATRSFSALLNPRQVILLSKCAGHATTGKYGIAQPSRKPTSI